MTRRRWGELARGEFYTYVNLGVVMYRGVPVFPVLTVWFEWERA